MITLSHGLQAELAPRQTHRIDRVRPPAQGFWHNGKLNMGPAVCLAVALSLLGWAGIIGAADLIRSLF